MKPQSMALLEIVLSVTVLTLLTIDPLIIYYKHLNRQTELASYIVLL